MNKIILILLCLPFSVWATTCEIPKESIVVSNIGLGKSVIDLEKKHKGVQIGDGYSKGAKSNLLYLGSDLEKDWLSGTPINSFIYISYDKKSKKIDGYNVSFNLDSLSTLKFKNVLVEIYNLPKSGWVYKVDDADAKYGEEYSYTYNCKDYRLYISQSGFGSTMIVSEN